MTKTTDFAAAKAFLTELCGGEQTAVLAAVSGGLDSMCLLHLLMTWGRPRGICVTAAHFNHRIRGAESDRDEAFVRDWCAIHDVPLIAGQGDVRGVADEKGLSLEEAAREMRYGFLEDARCQAGCFAILTAHHADDNAETVLLNLVRGTGLRGLCGIPAHRGRIHRPFSGVSRAELAAYAEENGIPYVEDSTNALDDAARNVLRHRVLPVLKELNPRAVENMARAASLLTADEAALESAVEALLTHAEICPGVSARLSAAVLDAAPAAVRSRAVLAALAVVAGHRKDLNAAHTAAILQLERGQLSLPCGVTALREGDDLRLLHRAAAPEACAIAPGETVCFGAWRVTLTEEPGAAGVAVSFPKDASLTVTAWDPRARLNGRTLKRLWADRGILPLERELLPVFRINGQAAAAAFLNQDQNFAPGRYETAARVIFFKETEENDYAQ